MSQPEKRILWGIIGSAIAVRCLLVLISPPTVEADLTPFNDPTDYVHLAKSLWAGRGWVGPSGEPTAFRPPLFPLAIAPAVGLFPLPVALVLIALGQCLLAGVAVCLMHRIARAIGLPAAPALLAAAAYGSYPAFILQTKQILTEELGRVLLLATVSLLLTADRTLRYSAAGALLGLAVLNKSVLAAALPLVGLVPLLRAGSISFRLKRAVAFTAPVALLMGLWTARNAAVSGAFVPVSTNFPITFAQGVTRFSYYSPIFVGEDVLLPAPPDYLRLTQLRNYSGIAEEISVGREWADRAKEWIAQNPGRFAYLTFRKGLHYWNPLIRNSPAVQVIAFASMAPVLFFGWIGLVSCLRTTGPRRRFAYIALAIGLSTWIPYAISQPDVRYRLGLAEPLWMLAAAAFVAPYLPRSFSSGPLAKTLES